ncbi:MAG: hypothetical protein ACFFED_15325 [Candidatus Thorarchaeota archaeon]
MRKSQFPQSKTLQEYIETIKAYAYPELSEVGVLGTWKRITSFAFVELGSSITSTIRCNLVVKKWPEPALIGLLAHELSHIVQRNTSPDEQNTDLDAISRGLGVYLAIERVYIGKYFDHVIRSGKDRYLGYQEIRSLLDGHEIEQLDALLEMLGMLPSLHNDM